jgi:hypothetical protein
MNCGKLVIDLTGTPPVLRLGFPPDRTIFDQNNKTLEHHGARQDSSHYHPSSLAQRFG